MDFEPLGSQAFQFLRSLSTSLMCVLPCGSWQKSCNFRQLVTFIIKIEDYEHSSWWKSGLYVVEWKQMEMDIILASKKGSSHSTRAQSLWQMLHGTYKIHNLCVVSLVLFENLTATVLIEVEQWALVLLSFVTVANPLEFWWLTVTASFNSWPAVCAKCV